MAADTPNFTIRSVDGKFAGNAEFLGELNRRIDALQMSTGVYLDAKAEIYVVPDRAGYQALASGKNALVEFSDAFYSSQEQRIYIRSSNQIWSNYGGVILHEYTHWYLDQLLMGAPLWFHEGLATQTGNQLGLDRYLYYVRERFWGNKMDLFSLAYQYPQERKDWEMYYLSSFFAVKYMQDSDPQAWRQFWQSVAENAKQGRETRFTSAFGAAYHSNLYAFNLEFAAASKRQAWIYLVIGANSLLFALLPFLVIYGVLRYRKRMQALPDLPLPESEEESPEPEEEG